MPQMSERPVRGVCVVCKGEVVEKMVTKFDPLSGPSIIGPGSVNQYKKVSEGYYCKGCGLKYEFV